MGKDYTEAQKRASLAYQTKNAQIKITVSKEQKEKYQKIAERKNKSLTRLIVELLEKEAE